MVHGGTENSISALACLLGHKQKLRGRQGVGCHDLLGQMASWQGSLSALCILSRQQGVGVLPAVLPMVCMQQAIAPELLPHDTLFGVALHHDESVLRSPSLICTHVRTWMLTCQ